MKNTPEIYDKHTMNTLNAYFHLKAACNYLDLPISDRKIFTNKEFMKQMTDKLDIKPMVKVKF